MRIAYVLTAVAAMATFHEPASATTCFWGAVIRPAPLAAAPIDSHVWITLPSDWATQDLCAPGVEGPCKADPWQLALQSAAVTGVPAVEVPVVRRDTPGHHEMTIELVPAAPLAADTRYEVWMIDPSRTRPPRFLSTFKTGTVRDRIAPAWSGRVTLQRYFDPALRRRGTIDVTSPTVRTLWLSADLATDADDAAAPVLFGLWLADASGVIAYDRPAAAYLRQDPSARLLARPGSAPAASLRLGGGGGAVDCDLANFEIPAGTRSLRIGVRALDLAGNASKPAELTLKLGP